MAGKGAFLMIIMFFVVVDVLMVAGGEVSSAAPNSWFSCMLDCPKYNCVWYMPEVACQAYCATLCAIPPANTNTLAAADHAVDRFCKLGCITSHCAITLSSVSGHEEAVKGCVHGCTAICNTPTKLPGNPVV